METFKFYKENFKQKVSDLLTGYILVWFHFPIVTMICRFGLEGSKSKQ